MAKSLDERLKVVATRLGKSYLAWKANEAKKEANRKDFFALATEAMSETELAEDIVEVRAPDESKARDRVKQKYPAWIVEAVQEHPKREGWFEVIISENPELLPFVYEAGFKIKRSVSKGSPFIDDERLREEDPELWEEVTVLPYKGLLEELLYNSGVDHREFEEEYEGQEPYWQRDWVKKVLEDHGLRRQLRSLDDLDSETLARLQEYIYEGRPSVKLSPVTKVDSE